MHKVFTMDKCAHFVTRVHNKMIKHQMCTKYIKMLVETIMYAFRAHSCLFSWSVGESRGGGRKARAWPGNDVVELTSASRPVLMITFASGIATRKSAPSMGNSPVLAVGHQSKSAQNVGHSYNIDYRLWRRLIE